MPNTSEACGTRVDEERARVEAECLLEASTTGTMTLVEQSHDSDGWDHELKWAGHIGGQVLYPLKHWWRGATTRASWPGSPLNVGEAVYGYGSSILRRQCGWGLRWLCEVSSTEWQAREWHFSLVKTWSAAACASVNREVEQKIRNDRLGSIISDSGTTCEGSTLTSGARLSVERERAYTTVGPNAFGPPIALFCSFLFSKLEFKFIFQIQIDWI